IARPKRGAGIINRQHEKQHLLIEIFVEKVDEQLDPWSPSRRQAGLTQWLRQKKARKPDEADVENRDAQIGEFARSEPYHPDTQDQGIQAMQPPEYFLMTMKPSDQRTVEIRQGLFDGWVRIRHIGEETNCQ